MMRLDSPSSSFHPPRDDLGAGEIVHLFIRWEQTP